jgi:hypothetical protein
MNTKALIGIGIGAIAVGIFLLAVTNPNLRENKDTYFGFIETTQESTQEPEPEVEDLLIPPPRETLPELRAEPKPEDDS